MNSPESQIVPMTDTPQAEEIPSQAKKIVQTYKSSSNRQVNSPKNPKWHLVESYLPLLKSIVARMRIYFPETVDINDIYGIALAGLISAAQHFDETRGSAFGGYATMRIKGALLDELRRMDWMPRGERGNAKRYRKAIEDLEQKLKRPVTDEEICKELGISAVDNQRIKESQKPIVCIPLDMAPSGEDPDTSSLHEVIADLTELNGRDIVEDKEVIQLLKTELEALPKVPQKVLALYYLEGLRLAEIAEVFELSESRICQIHAQAIVTLRKALKEKMLK